MNTIFKIMNLAFSSHRDITQYKIHIKLSNAIQEIKQKINQQVKHSYKVSYGPTHSEGHSQIPF